MDNFDFKKYLTEGRIHQDSNLNEKQDSKKGNSEEQKRAEGAIKDDRDHIKALKKDIEDQERKLAKLKKDYKKDVVKEAKKQGYNDELDDSEGAKHGKKKQDMKQRRADSENAEKADGKRKFAGDSKMKEELGEALAAINELKAELNEVNLLNAKLLYTNKIFKAKNLNESKKVKVLKAFDKAKSVEQAKTIFETLSEGITSSVNTPTINESIKRGAASKASGLVPKANVQPIIESNDVYNRMRKLAGLL